MEMFLIRALQLVLALTILVFLHEGGHFLFSKLFGVRVNKFYVFFDYKFRLFSTYSNWWRKLRGKKPVKKNSEGEYEYDGTEYGIGWIPLGGYCQIEGMIDETQHDVTKLQQAPKPYEFRGKPCWQRLLIMLGGVMVNFFLALIIYSAVLYTWGEDYIAMKDMTMGMKFNDKAKELGFKDGDILLGTNLGDFREFSADVFRDLTEASSVNIKRDGKTLSLPLSEELNLLEMLQSNPMFARPLVPCDIDSVFADSPAAKAGLMKGDRIVALNGKPIDSWNEMSYQLGILDDCMTAAKSSADSLKLRSTVIVAERKDKSLDTLNMTLTPDLKLGVIKTEVYNYYTPTHVSYSFLESIPAGSAYGINVLGGYVSDLKYVFTSDGAKSLGGFGAIGSLFPPMWDWMLFWKMTAFLSIILAFMNLLPIPALDGGHVLFLLYEMVTRRKPSDKFLLVAQYAGMILLFALMILANLNDVLRFFGIL